MGQAPRVVWMPGGVRTELHLDGKDTGGALCLLVDHPPPGWSLPAHRHRNERETIHVVQGEFELEIEGARCRLRAGETVHVAPGAVHSGANVGERTGRRVVVFAPAGIEGFFLETGAVGPREPVDYDAALRSAERHGWEFLAPAG